MSYGKKLEDPEASLATLRTYFETLGIDTPEIRMHKLGALLGSRVDRVRLFRQDEDTRIMVSVTPLDPAQLGQMAQPDPLGFVEVGGPNVTIDLTVKEDGSVALGLEDGSTLAGQDLAQLSRAVEDPADTQEFDVPLGDEYISAQEAADRLGVAKSTVTRRIKENEVIGFRVFKKALRIPRAQFANGDVVGGINDVISLFEGDHKETWHFLSSSIFYGDSAPRPIDRLRAARGQRALKDCLEELKAAKASYDYGDHF